MERKWWQNAIAYQIYPKSFCDSNGDGIGDIRGIISKLDYLQDLGVDVVWISPMYRSPMVDNGYDISDYYDIDPQFGTMADMDELISEADKRGIKIIMDLVINHSSDQHAWFQNALTGPDALYRDYYVFKDGKDGRPPNNWRSQFGGSAWEQVPDGQYYLHVFAKQQPDLNWENPKLRQELADMVNFWLEKGLGGFRVDAITYIKKKQDFADLPADADDGMGDIYHACLNQPGIGDFLTELREKTFDRFDCMTVAEAPGVPYEDLGDYISDHGYFSMIFDFSYADLDLENSNGVWCKPTPWTVNHFRELLYQSQLAVQKEGWGAVYLENHDQPRSLTKYLPEADRQYPGITMLATLYFLLRGTPFIYQGQELGMDNCPMDSIDEFDDLSTKDQYQRGLDEGLTPEEALRLTAARSRDMARTPFQWDDTANAGFTTGTPWLKVNPAYHTVNAKAQCADAHSIHAYYKALVRLRKHSEYSDIFGYGTFAPALEQYDNVVAYTRTWEGKRLLVINNYQNKEIVVHLEEPIQAVVLNNYEGDAPSGQDITLKPYQSLVLA